MRACAGCDDTFDTFDTFDTKFQNIALKINMFLLHSHNFIYLGLLGDKVFALGKAKINKFILCFALVFVPLPQKEIV